MDFALDKALKEMTLEENNPIKLKYVPKLNARERNGCSLMGRLLNPGFQKMSSLIHDMPRYWRVYERCRGIALSNEAFQFVFDSESELQTVLNAGAWTYEDWSMVLERWVEEPPENYLKTIPIWVRMRNVPLVWYDAEAIEEIVGHLGQVTEAAFDPMKPQSKGFVRVKILFDVSKLLSNSKEFELPEGEVVSIKFEYERIRKRCYSCQRLTHDKSKCLYDPLNRHLGATVKIP
ncbi:hypothetical protein V5N11_036230 [Cardamine amara subsp. amara]|uniref:DUF4283 domain-containing protein n=1 Tax=Cardamine amara subsp. amara TaxID=228776 RepID=A0ABD0ZLF0_CARAN